jgi:hypothetical protein
MVSFFDRAGSYCKNLCSIDELDQILKEYENTKRGEEENEIRSILSSEGMIDTSINSNPKNGSQDYG